MKNLFLIHDAVWATVPKLVGIFAPLLRPEEQKEAASEIYRVLREAFTQYEIDAERLAARLNGRAN